MKKAIFHISASAKDVAPGKTAEILFVVPPGIEFFPRKLMVPHVYRDAFCLFDEIPKGWTPGPLDLNRIDEEMPPVLEFQGESRAMQPGETIHMKARNFSNKTSDFHAVMLGYAFR